MRTRERDSLVNPPEFFPTVPTDIRKASAAELVQEIRRILCESLVGGEPYAEDRIHRLDQTQRWRLSDVLEEQERRAQIESTGK